jgi:hypothetical protein
VDSFLQLSARGLREGERDIGRRHGTLRPAAPAAPIDSVPEPRARSPEIYGGVPDEVLLCVREGIADVIEPDAESRLGS